MGSILVARLRVRFDEILGQIESRPATQMAKRMEPTARQTLQAVSVAVHATVHERMEANSVMALKVA
jgi:hypothetical protein